MSQSKIKIEDLTMIFGPNPHEKALPMLREGRSKEDILEQTGHVVGVNGASFTVAEGEIFVVMGLSGSGKSTLIRCVNRLIDPTHGHIYIDDEDILTANVNRVRELRRTKISMVFQHFALMPHKTVVENAAYGLKVRGLSAKEQREKAIEALDLVGLKEWADRFPNNLSGGMQQRVGLARALATDAEVLLMDEAFSALDPLIRRQMQNELLDLQERLQKTVLFITHDLNEALRVGNHIAIMREGAIIQIGTPVEIITQPADDYVAAFTQDVDYGRVLTAEIVMTPAETLIAGRDAFTHAVKQIESKDEESAWYVVGQDRKLQGYLRHTDLLEAHGAPGNGKTNLDEFIESECPQTPLSTPLSELYALCADGMPVAVVDKSGRLKGVVRPLDVLNTLSASIQNDPDLIPDNETNGASR